MPAVSLEGTRSGGELFSTLIEDRGRAEGGGLMEKERRGVLVTRARARNRQVPISEKEG